MAESDTVSLCGDLEAINKCPICLEPLNQPKLLPCGHSFCFTCLQSHYTTGGRFGIIVCSMDRSRHPLPRGGIDGLPGDHRSTQTIEALRKHKNTKVVAALPKCGFCQSSANIHCIQCNTVLCSSCSKKHEKAQAFANHLVLFISPQNIRDLTCSNHNNQFKTEFCSVCHCLICKACVLDDHDTHHVTPLVDMDNTEIGKIMKDVETILKTLDGRSNQLSSFKDNMEGKQMQIIQEINQHIDGLIDVLEAKRKRLTVETEKYFKQHETFHSSLLSTLSDDESKVRNIETNIKRNTQLLPMNPNLVPKTIDISGLKQQVEALRMSAFTLPNIECEFIPYESLDVGEVSVSGHLQEPSSAPHVKELSKKAGIGVYFETTLSKKVNRKGRKESSKGASNDLDIQDPPGKVHRWDEKECTKCGGTMKLHYGYGDRHRHWECQNFGCWHEHSV